MLKKRHNNKLFIPESFNTIVSHQLFDYKNSQHENTNSKDDFVLNNLFETLVLKITRIKK